MTPLFAVITPMAGAFILPLAHLYWHKLPGKVIPLWGVMTFAASIAAALSGWDEPSVAFMGGWSAELGIVLVVDKLSAAFLVLAAFGSGTALLLSYASLAGGPWRYYVLFFLLQAATNGIIVTGDMFNLFVGYEIFSVAAYLLVAFTMSWQALEAGLKYLILGTIGAMFILLGTAYIFMATGTLNFAVLATQMPRVPPEALSVIAACLLIGLSLKIGAFPFHFWLPDAHSSARTAISALLSGVMIKVSIYALIRVSFLFFYQSKPEVFTAIAALGTLSILGGHILAYRQRDIKRLLAYSTVAQIGYILLGVGSGTAAGVTAAVFHAFGHMVMKSGLFVTAGHLADDMKTREIPEMKGLFRYRPRFVTVFSLLAAGIVGIPPLAGFMGKWFLMRASAESGNILPALALGAGTVISAAYYLRVLKSFFAPGEQPSRRRPAFWPLAVSGALAACCIMLGLVPFLSPLWGVFASIGDQTLDVAGYIAVVTGR